MCIAGETGRKPTDHDLLGASGWTGGLWRHGPQRLYALEHHQDSSQRETENPVALNAVGVALAGRRGDGGARNGACPTSDETKHRDVVLVEVLLAQGPVRRIVEGE